MDELELERICKQKEYTLDFYQALKEMFENGAWIKGSDFVPGHYMKSNNLGDTVLVNVKNFSIEQPLHIHKGLIQQKYRLIKVATLKELRF